MNSELLHKGSEKRDRPEKAQLCKKCAGTHKPEGDAVSSYQVVANFVRDYSRKAGHHKQLLHLGCDLEHRHVNLCLARSPSQLKAYEISTKDDRNRTGEQVHPASCECSSKRNLDNRLRRFITVA